jgi:UDP-N-acetyl-D-mannosaminuronate dehydrogenase
MHTPDNGLAYGSRTALQLHLTVIGIGYLELTHAACIVDLGHEVLAIDVDRKRIEKAAAGEAPFFEPGLELLLRKSQETGWLCFTTSYEELAEFGGLHSKPFSFAATMQWPDLGKEE